MDFLKPQSFHELLLVIGLRYFVVAAIFWVVWYKLLRLQIAHKKIQPRFPTDWIFTLQHSDFLRLSCTDAADAFQAIHAVLFTHSRLQHAMVLDRIPGYFFSARCLFLLDAPAAAPSAIIQNCAPYSSQINQSFALGGILISSDRRHI